MAALACLAAPTAGATASSPGRAAAAKYAAAPGRRIAYHAVRLPDGAVIASSDAQTPMTPASVQKIVTAATALDVLGEPFQFRTTLATYRDDLLVIGDGDPTLGDPVLAAARGGTIYDTLDEWIAALKAKGVTAVKGNLVLDDNIFRERRHPDWPDDQRQRYYCAPVSGLNFNDNCLDVRLRLTDGGVAAEISPASGRIRVLNTIRRGNKQLWRAALSDNDATLTLTGRARTSMIQPVSIAVDHPTLLFGRVLADRLARGGVAFGGRILRRTVVGPDRTLPAGPKVVAEHATPLAAVLARANKRSLNLVAECLILRAGVASAGRGSFEQAAQTASRSLRERYGVPAEQFTIADGSGMSRNNRLAPAAAVRLLRSMIEGESGRSFLASLPVAGVDGTLAKRFRAYPGRVTAKTGTLSGVKTLAGYVLDAAGRPAIAFAVFCNHTRGTNWEAQQAIDALVADWIALTDGR